MSELRNRAVKGLKQGDTFTITRTFSQEETEHFGDLTRDYNPVHYDPDWAEAKGFSRLICHGLLVGGMVCELGGQFAWLATSMEFNYKKPVFFNDTITCRLEITSLDETTGRAVARAEFSNQNGQTVITAELGGIVPAGDHRNVLARIVSQGDRTNKLAD